MIFIIVFQHYRENFSSPSFESYLCPKHLHLKQLAAVNPYFWKYRYRFLLGIIFVISANYLAVLAPQITGYVVNQVQLHLPGAKSIPQKTTHDWAVDWFIKQIEFQQNSFGTLVAICSITILVLAIIRGILMFFMRQTIIVMSRHIEYDQKNEIYQHYQERRLDDATYVANYRRQDT